VDQSYATGPVFTYDETTAPRPLTEADVEAGFMLGEILIGYTVAPSKLNLRQSTPSTESYPSSTSGPAISTSPEFPQRISPTPRRLPANLPLDLA